MNLPQKKQLHWKYLGLAFAVPCVGMLFVMLVSGYEPFGKSSMLYSDMYHQYYPFFVAFRDALRSGDSLLYSWSVGLGMDYLGLISYYLGSPLNLLGVLVPEKWLLEYFSLMMPIKLGFAGFCFGYFLKHMFGKNDISISLFGACYALCAWALGYQWNVMWLDTFAVVPLVVLGMVQLLRDRKFILYTVSLFFAVCVNYYIGFFVCIFVFLLFFVYEICRWQSLRRFLADLCCIAAFSLLAIGLTAFLELPAYAALQTTQSSVNQFPQGFRMNIADENTWKGLLDAMRQVAGNLSGGIAPTFKEGLPNVYCGVGSLMLGFLYLMAKDVKLRDKICAFGMLIFFMLSFILRQLDYIWHGFHFTNMIPYRFSFLFSFVLLYMAYRAWQLRHSFKLWQVILAAVLSIGIMSCSDSARELTLTGGDTKASWIFLLYNGAFLLCYGVLMALETKKTVPPKKTSKEQLAKLHKEQAERREVLKYAMAGLLAAEMILNLVNFGINFTGTSVTNYPKGTEHAASMIRYMKEREEDTLFFRAEATHSQSLNDGALNHYNGVSTFTSSANVKVTEFMKALGYGAKNTYNRYCFEEASPVSNLFLNLKYMIERDGRNKESAWFREIHRYGNVALLGNNAYLPLGFLANPELADVDFFGELTGFPLQNEIMLAAAGTENVWSPVSFVDMQILATDVVITDQNSNGYCAYKEGRNGATISYHYTVASDGFMCVEVDFPKRNNLSIWKNGVELYSESISLPQMLAVGDVCAGDLVEVRAICKSANESGTLTVRAAVLDTERFVFCHEVLSECPLELTEFSNTRVEGTINCNRDGLLYTSIPQNGNWSVKVDGEEAAITLIGDAMIGVELTEGEHEVVFTYRNPAFTLGAVISVVSLAIFIGLVYLSERNKAPRGKYEKKAPQ